MACTSVTHNKWPNNTEWEEMRPIITDIWVNRARNRKDLVNILRGEYSFMATYVIAPCLPFTSSYSKLAKAARTNLSRAERRHVILVFRNGVYLPTRRGQRQAPPAQAARPSL
jgi:hypothetical protein